MAMAPAMLESSSGKWSMADLWAKMCPKDINVAFGLLLYVLAGIVVWSLNRSGRKVFLINL